MSEAAVASDELSERSIWLPGFSGKSPLDNFQSKTSSGAVSRPKIAPRVGQCWAGFSRKSPLDSLQTKAGHLEPFRGPKWPHVWGAFLGWIF